jgi:hypothetical protein
MQGSGKSVETIIVFHEIIFLLKFFIQGGHPAAQKENSASQLRFENQRFFDILSVFPQFLL